MAELSAELTIRTLWAGDSFIYANRICVKTDTNHSEWDNFEFRDDPGVEKFLPIGAKIIPIYLDERKEVSTPSEELDEVIKLLTTSKRCSAIQITRTVTPRNKYRLGELVNFVNILGEFL